MSMPRIAAQRQNYSLGRTAQFPGDREGHRSDAEPAGQKGRFHLLKSRSHSILASTADALFGQVAYPNRVKGVWVPFLREG
jgi:hypothetical protein